MADKFVAPNALRPFTTAMDPEDSSGANGYVDSLNANNNALRNVVNALDAEVEQLQAATGLAAQADAATNIPNLLINGGFNISTAHAVIADPVANPTNAVENVVRCPGWWFLPTIAGGMTARITDIAGIPPFTYPVHNAMHIWSTGTPGTGVVFQRVDLFHDLDLLKGKTIQFQVRYSSLVEDEFHIEVDDGVAVSTSISITQSAGTNQILTIPHTVQAGADKLTVRIVIDEMIPSSPFPLRIIDAYCRVGAGSFIIPANAFGRPTLLDEIGAKMVWRDYSYDLMDSGVQDATGTIPSPGTSGGAIEHWRDRERWEIPVIYEDADDLILQTLVTPGPLANAIHLLTLSPVVTFRTRDWINNTPGGVAATRLAIEDHQVDIYRLVGPIDPVPAPFDGFSGEFDFRVDVQPSP